MLNPVVKTVCKRCGRAMRSVAEIASNNGHPGLLAFACAVCSTTQSVFLYSGGALQALQDETPLIKPKVIPSSN